jgi:hypothetical protein
MSTLRETFKGREKIIVALKEFDYLTVSQLIRLFYAPSSRTFVQKELTAAVDEKFAVAITPRSVTLPRLYTLTAKGHRLAVLLGAGPGKRVRPSEEQAKGDNTFFLRHIIAVTDILIAARLLSRAVPDIVLTRLYTERSIKRKIYVASPAGDQRHCIEPDGSLDFVLQGQWQSFFHLELYRTKLTEQRFKHKIASYVAYIRSPVHEQLFQTPALAIAMFCQPDGLARTLKRWTEEVLHNAQQEGLGERFYFRSITDTATASPQELFLSPVWEQAFSSVKTPLLILE